MMKALITLCVFSSSAFSSTIYSVTSFTIPGSEVVLNQINDTGEIAGYMFPSSGGSVSAFVLSAGGIITVLPLSGGEVQAYGINNFGQVTGFANAPGFIYYPDGTSTLFSVAGSNLITEGKGINDAGEVVGVVESTSGGSTVNHGFLRAPNGTLTIFDVPGTNITDLEGINDSGEIVGSYEDSNGVSHGFTMEANGADFTSFDECNYEPGRAFPEGTIATAINNSGEVAGFCFSQTGAVGFIREPDGSFSTYGLDPNPALGNLTNTAFYGINDEDVLTGLYSVDNRTTAFIATPVPEASTFLLNFIVVSGILLARTRSIRRRTRNPAYSTAPYRPQNGE
jgi:hypothetical protein